jgi:tetratricopeptide (TPR) repeat protein
VLLVVTFRPEFDPPWIGRPYVTALTINRLAQRDIEAMIDRLVGNKLLPENIRRDIIERTDGIPLFVEEMTKSVLEAGSEEEAQRTAATVPSKVLAVPASLHAFLMARLDRLGPAKEVAQIGAAIGREFSRALMAAVTRKGEGELQSALHRLMAAGLLFRQGAPSNATYLFKHALVRDAAYGTLLREPRRALHARIADVLESEFADIAESQPELLARHYTEAGVTEKAARLWGKAGQRSLERSALIEAIAQLTRALDQIGAMPTTPALRQEQIGLHVALITPLIHVRGFAAPETRAAAEQARLLIERAEAIGEAPKDPLLIFSVLYAFWAANFLAFNGDLCRDLATHFLALAQKRGGNIALMVGHTVMGTTLALTGDIAESRSHLDQAIALYDPAAHRPLASRFGQDAAVAILAYRATALWMLGYPEAALADTERMLSDARAMGQAGTLMYALIHASRIYLFCGDYATGNALIDECITLAEEKNAVFWKASAIRLKGPFLVESGKASDAVHTMKSARTGLRSSGSTAYATSTFSSWSSAYADLGQFDDAGRYIAKAFTAVETT